MSINKLPYPGATFNTEQSTALVPISAASSAASGNIITVTATAHGLSVGQVVTFTGATPTTYLVTAFTILSVPTADTFTIFSTLGAITFSTGTVVPLFYPASGTWFFSMGANALVEYNPTNDGYPNGPDDNPTRTGATWRTIIAASAADIVPCDGFGVRIKCSGTAATSRYSQVK